VDFFGFLPPVKGAVLQTELDQVLEMLWGWMTHAGFPADNRLAGNAQELCQPGLGQIAFGAKNEDALTKLIVTLGIR
jgi:hypothetical protein